MNWKRPCRASPERWKIATMCRPRCAISNPWMAWNSSTRLNLSRCIGCRKCVHACVAENNQSRRPEIQYIRVLEMPRGTMDLEQGDHYYDRPTGARRRSFLHAGAVPPVQESPLCQGLSGRSNLAGGGWDCGHRLRLVHRLPVLRGGLSLLGARVLISPNRRFPKTRLNPDMAYLSNRPRPKGVVEKCHFCLQRTRQGRMPACLEVCPTGSRKFGNVLDPAKRGLPDSQNQSHLRSQGGSGDAAPIFLLLR